jgi:anti-sigma B factor antagonist
MSPGDKAVMLPFTPIETDETLVVRLDNPERFNDFRSDDYRESLYQSVLSKPEPLVALDLSPIDHLSSTGIAILVGLKRRVEAERGKLVLFRMQPFLHDLLSGMKLNTYFAIADCEQDALALLRPTAAV